MTIYTKGLSIVKALLEDQHKILIRMVAGFGEMAERKEFCGCGGLI
jgi:hypothetical protein